MPEIAEVETVRNTLKRLILNKKIVDVKIIYPKIIESNISDFRKILQGRQIIDIDRRGKWLMFDLEDYYLLSHLRMEGKFFVKNSDEEIVKHEHIIISFEDHTDLRYHDTRKFGRMNLVKKSDINNVEAIKKQGIEANIWAVGANEAKANGAKADVVLLGPQVRYLEATVKKEVAPTPAQLIDMRSYGRMDGAAVLKQAMDLIEANK